MRVSFERFHAAAGEEVPGANRLVVGSREEELARGVEDQGANPIVVCGEGGQRYSFRKAPKSRNSRPTCRGARGQLRFSRMERKTTYKSLEALTAGRVPQLDRLVARASRCETSGLLSICTSPWSLEDHKRRSTICALVVGKLIQRTAIPASSRMAAWAAIGAKTATSTTCSCPRSSDLVSPV